MVHVQLYRLVQLIGTAQPTGLGSNSGIVRAEGVRLVRFAHLVVARRAGELVEIQPSSSSHLLTINHTHFPNSTHHINQLLIN